MLASSQIGISLLYFLCQADCRGIVVFSFYNILTQHLAHKNSIRLIAYYLFIYYPKSGLVIFKFNLLNCLVMLQMCQFEVKFSFNSPEQEESSTKGRHKMGYAPWKALCFRVL